MAKRSRAIAILVLLGTAFALLVVFVRARQGIDPEMESLVGLVIQTGDSTPIHPKMLQTFGLPDGAASKAFTRGVISETGLHKAIQVLIGEDSNEINVFLVDFLRNGAGENYYLTGWHGRLTMALFLDANAKANQVENEVAKFKVEKDFWLLWRSEELKLLGSSKQSE